MAAPPVLLHRFAYHNLQIPHIRYTMNRHRFTFSVLLALIPLVMLQPTSSAHLGWQEPNRDDCSSLESQLLADVGDGRLDDFDLLQAALIAGGILDTTELARYGESFQQRMQLGTEGITHSQKPTQQAIAVLELLHKHLLTGVYDAGCSRLHQTLESGDFNCITATILYRCLTDRMNLPVETVAEPGHVYCRWTLDSTVNIQTTSSRGFGVAEPCLPQSPASEAASSAARPQSHVQLLGKIYYNRGVDALERCDFSEATRLLTIACRLDAADRTARQNLLACLNNWALSESHEQHYQFASQLLTYGMQLEPDYAPLRENELHVYHRWVTSLCREHQYQAAAELLQDGYQRRPEAPLFARGRRVVYLAWSRWYAVNGKEDEARAILQSAADYLAETAIP